MLTKRQRQVLEMLADGEELVYERGQAWIGNEQTNGATVMALNRMCALKLDSFSTVGKFERYTINETGRLLLAAERTK